MIMVRFRSAEQADRRTVQNRRKTATDTGAISVKLAPYVSAANQRSTCVVSGLGKEMKALSIKNM